VDLFYFSSLQADTLAAGDSEHVRKYVAEVKRKNVSPKSGVFFL